MGVGFLSFSIGLVFGYFAKSWAWTSFVFIVSLFTWRGRLDDSQCAEKWAEYRSRAKCRILPGVY